VLFSLLSFLLNLFLVGENENGQITSQMLLVCCWRTIKEISLLFSRLGQIGIQFIQSEEQYRFISLKQVFYWINYQLSIFFLFRLMLYVIIIWNNY
jgi:hypothetical protein